MRTNEIVIIPPKGELDATKGSFFEELLTHVMDTQRYKITQRINFTGTEIDLLCEHRDRSNETALLECKARKDISANHLKTFAYDVLVQKRAQIGFFVHTNQLQHQAAGIVKEWDESGQSTNLFVWGPEKVSELLEHAGYINQPDESDISEQLHITKRILLICESGKFWVYLLAAGNVPTHYAVFDGGSRALVTQQIASKLAENIEDISAKLIPVTSSGSITLSVTAPVTEAVAEVQECEQWDDYRPASSRYFVGRRDLRSRIWRFINAIRSRTTERRVFFIEGKSGWGKSSVVADLRARSRNARYKNWLFCFAADSRSAVSSDFPARAFAKMIERASEDKFLPKHFSSPTISSSTAIIQSQDIQVILDWLTTNDKIMVLIFDQFEDIFRRTDLFKSFYYLMMAVNEIRSNLIIGFSWKSEIHIPMDNPAYNYWQVARDSAEGFTVQQFDNREISAVLRQLEAESQSKLSMDLRRRLVEISQGFPWLIKKMAIHCYRQFRKGVTSEQLVDQDLNAELLFREDMEGLDVNATRALNYIAQRAYDGDAFDAMEIDDKISGEIINSLLNIRLVIRSGSKYNVYWDIFQEYLVTGEVPRIGESFLLRQYPRPCIDILAVILKMSGRESLIALRDAFPSVSEGTLLNRLRELRHLGLLSRDQDWFVVRPGITSMEEVVEYLTSRLDAHVVVSTLRKSQTELVTHAFVVEVLKARYPTYQFCQKTWGIYASYLTAWMRYVAINLSGRLVGPSVLPSPESFTPQLLADKVVDGFFNLEFSAGSAPRKQGTNKLIYDLKALGLVTYTRDSIFLTPRGRSCLQLPRDQAFSEIASYAYDTAKIEYAVELLRSDPAQNRRDFAEGLTDLLAGINSRVYKGKVITVLRSWAEYVVRNIR